ncbi:MAG: hypothetical protein ACO1NW_17255 [Chitinophagaceae bacterium]
MKETTNEKEETNQKLHAGRISILVIAALILEIIFFSLFTKHFS